MVGAKSMMEWVRSPFPGLIPPLWIAIGLVGHDDGIYPNALLRQRAVQSTRETGGAIRCGHRREDQRDGA
jgi:hypothetical protein